MHVFFIEDETGDIVDEIPFCSDHCHHAWCELEGETYGGWNGCQESSFDTECAYCGSPIEGVQ